MTSDKGVCGVTIACTLRMAYNPLNTNDNKQKIKTAITDNTERAFLIRKVDNTFKI